MLRGWLETEMLKGRRGAGREGRRVTCMGQGTCCVWLPIPSCPILLSPAASTLPRSAHTHTGGTQYTHTQVEHTIYSSKGATANSSSCISLFTDWRWPTDPLSQDYPQSPTEVPRWYVHRRALVMCSLKCPGHVFTEVPCDVFTEVPCDVFTGVPWWCVHQSDLWCVHWNARSWVHRSALVIHSLKWPVMHLLKCSGDTFTEVTCDVFTEVLWW